MGEWKLLHWATHETLPCLVKLAIAAAAGYLIWACIKACQAIL